MAERARAFYLAAAAAANLAGCATNHAAHEPAPSIGPPAPAQNNTPKPHWWQAAWQHFREEPLTAKALYVVGAAGVLFVGDTWLHRYGDRTANENQGNGGSLCPPGTTFSTIVNATNSTPGSAPAYSCIYQNQPSAQGSKHSGRSVSLQFGKSW